MAKEFTDENIHDIIASGAPVVIDFWATWCGPCMAMGPIVDELAEKYAGQVEIGKYNTDDNSDLAVQYRVMSIPTFLFFKDGKKVDIRLTGAQPKATLDAKIQELLAL